MEIIKQNQKQVLEILAEIEKIKDQVKYLNDLLIAELQKEQSQTVADPEITLNEAISILEPIEGKYDAFIAGYDAGIDARVRQEKELVKEIVEEDVINNKELKDSLNDLLNDLLNYVFNDEKKAILEVITEYTNFSDYSETSQFTKDLYKRIENLIELVGIVVFTEGLRAAARELNELEKKTLS